MCPEKDDAPGISYQGRHGPHNPLERIRLIGAAKSWWQYYQTRLLATTPKWAIFGFWINDFGLLILTMQAQVKDDSIFAISEYHVCF